MAYIMDGDTAKHLSGTVAISSTASPCTVLVWFKRTDTIAQVNGLFQIGIGNGNSDRRFTLKVATNNRVQSEWASTGTSGTTDAITNNPLADVNTWHVAGAHFENEIDATNRNGEAQFKGETGNQALISYDSGIPQSAPGNMTILQIGRYRNLSTLNCTAMKIGAFAIYTGITALSTFYSLVTTAHGDGLTFKSPSHQDMIDIATPIHDLRMNGSLTQPTGSLSVTNNGSGIYDTDMPTFAAESGGGSSTGNRLVMW